MDRKPSYTLCCEHSIRGSRETGGHDYKPLDVFVRFVSSTVVARCHSVCRCKFVDAYVRYVHIPAHICESWQRFLDRWMHSRRVLEQRRVLAPPSTTTTTTMRAQKHSNERFLFPSAATTTTTTSAVMEWQLHSGMDFSQWMSSAMCCDE